MYELIIFDFDYTLVDSSRGIVDCISFALQDNGHPIPPENEIKDTIGLSLLDTFRELTGDSLYEHYQQFQASFLERSEIVMCQKTVPFADTASTLKAIHHMGIRIAIASSKNRKAILEISDHNGFDDYLAYVVSEDDVMNTKPHPQCITMVLDHFGLSVNQALFVGDSFTDALTAKNAGIDFVGVTTGTTDAEKFRQLPHVAIVPDLHSVLDILFPTDPQVSDL